MVHCVLQTNFKFRKWDEILRGHTSRVFFTRCKLATGTAHWEGSRRRVKRAHRWVVAGAVFISILPPAILGFRLIWPSSFCWIACFELSRRHARHIEVHPPIRLTCASDMLLSLFSSRYLWWQIIMIGDKEIIIGNHRAYCTQEKIGFGNFCGLDSWE